jgi:hypothetical protein
MITLKKQKEGTRINYVLEIPLENGLVLSKKVYLTNLKELRDQINFIIKTEDAQDNS